MKRTRYHLILRFAAISLFIAGIIWLIAGIVSPRLAGKWTSTENERAVLVRLKKIVEAQKQFHDEDRDGNGKSDYWREDIMGLYFAKGADGRPLKMIELAIALADGNSMQSTIEFGEPAPTVGYWFKSLTFFGEKVPDPTKWAVVAYPDSMLAGRALFITDSSGKILKKAIDSPQNLEFYPANPEQEGWKPIE